MAGKRVRVVWTGTPVSGGGLSTFYFNDGNAAQDCVDAVGTFLGTIDTNMTTQIAWATEPDVVTFNLATGAMEAIEATTIASGTGADAGDWIPPASQGLLRLRTSGITNGREIRGRLFLPGMIEANSVAGAPTSALRTAINTPAAALIADADTAWSVWSRSSGSMAAITTATMWTKWASLRSRRD